MVVRISNLFASTEVSAVFSQASFFPFSQSLGGQFPSGEWVWLALTGTVLLISGLVLHRIAARRTRLSAFAWMFGSVVFPSRNRSGYCGSKGFVSRSPEDDQAELVDSGIDDELIYRASRFPTANFEIRCTVDQKVGTVGVGSSVWQNNRELMRLVDIGMVNRPQVTGDVSFPTTTKVLAKIGPDTADAARRSSLLIRRVMRSALIPRRLRPRAASGSCSDHSFGVSPISFPALPVNARSGVPTSFIPRIVTGLKHSLTTVRVMTPGVTRGDTDRRDRRDIRPAPTRAFDFRKRGSFLGALFSVAGVSLSESFRTFIPRHASAFRWVGIFSGLIVLFGHTDIIAYLLTFPIAFGVWTTPTTRTTGELITASIWNTDLVDDLIALQQGAIALVKVQFDGASSDPAVSAAGDATIAYNSASNQMRLSMNGGAYTPLGSGAVNDLQDWLFMSGGM